MKSRTKDVGIYRPEHSWDFSGEIEMDAPTPRAELDLGEDDGTT
jgi:hypothetical protein